jgi:hypothetical protein
VGAPVVGTAPKTYQRTPPAVPWGPCQALGRPAPGSTLAASAVGAGSVIPLWKFRHGPSEMGGYRFDCVGQSVWVASFSMTSDCIIIYGGKYGRDVHGPGLV